MRHLVYLRNISIVSVLMLLIVMFVGLTNHVEPYGTELNNFAAGDTNSYFAIAEVSPGWGNESVIYHHAQRFLFPYVIGLIAEATGASLLLLFKPAAWFFLLMLALSVYLLGHALGLSRLQRVLITSVMLLSPWATRYYLTFPVQAYHLLFHVGFAFVLIGLVKRIYLLIAVSLILMILVRQTALLILPGIVIWVLLDSRWQESPLWMRLGWLLGYGVITLGLYQLTSAIATQYGGDPNSTIDHIIGFLEWLRTPPALDDVIPMIARFIAALSIPVALIGSLLLTSEITWKTLPVSVWATAMMVLGIISQPILAGPLSTGNSHRLVSLGHIGFVFILGYLISMHRGDAVHQPSSIVVILSLIILSSFHHIYSIIGPNLGWSIQFAFAHLSIALILFSYVWHSQYTPYRQNTLSYD